MHDQNPPAGFLSNPMAFYRLIADMDADMVLMKLVGDCQPALCKLNKELIT